MKYPFALGRRVAVSMTAVGLLALSGCGGGVYLGIFDDQPPDVSLAASPGSARAGDTVRLVAAATDDFGIDRVEFYRFESNGSITLIGTDGVAPFQIDTTMPATSAATLQFFARAIDGANQAADSAAVNVAVLP